MAKKRIEPEAAPLKQNPFAALSAKKDEAPPAPPKPVEAARAAEPENAAESARASWGSGKVVLQRERKGRGGKTATRVRGLPEARLETLAAQMKKALGCGATVEEGDVILLGDVVERAAKWLRDAGAPRVIEGN
ncbi:MAG: translation initiation factor [Sandaracinus sp.]|nr:translation initiation factor [Sandaracinus sp.]MCB9604908.1 translation initiation factor [Sandaracinus sp.]